MSRCFRPNSCRIIASHAFSRPWRGLTRNFRIAKKRKRRAHNNFFLPTTTSTDVVGIVVIEDCIVTMSHAKRAIRFFGSVHTAVSSTPNPLRLAMTPEHFPKTLGLVTVLGVIAGYKFMESCMQIEVSLYEKTNDEERFPMSTINTHSKYVFLFYLCSVDRTNERMIGRPIDCTTLTGICTAIWKAPYHSTKIHHQTAHAGIGQSSCIDTTLEG